MTRGRRHRRAGPSRPAAPRRPWRRRRLLLAVVVLAAAVALALAAGWGPRDRRPLHLLVITMDTTRADHLGCYGASPSRTPNLDRLAAGGTLFERCISPVPLTLPAHASLFTGRYPFTHGIRRNGFERVPDGEVTLAEALRGPGLATRAIVASAVLAGTFGLAQGFDDYVDVPRSGARNPAAAEIRGDRVTDLAAAALRGRGDRRLFLWVHYYDPHHPYLSAEHPDADSPEAYADEVAFMDGQIGRLLDLLEELGLRESTLVVAVGDHGEGLGQHGESEHGYFVHDVDLHVPLILSCPGVVPKGLRVPSTCRLIDVAPTILDLLGSAMVPESEGASLRPLMAARTDEAPRLAYGETRSPEEVFGLAPLYCLYRETWKYILAPTPRLFDLARDPGETRNLAGEEPETAAAMRDALGDLIARGLSGSVGPLPAAGPNRQEIEALRSLGYIAGPTGAEEAGRGPDAPPGSPRGDPADQTEAIELYARSHRHTADRAWDLAEPYLREVVRRIPGAPNPLEDLSLSLRMQSRGAEMLAFCREVLRDHPGATPLRLHYARELVGAGKREEALAQLRTAVAEDPGSADARFRLGAMLSSMDRIDEARGEFERSLDLRPDDSRTLHALGTLLLREGRWGEAVARLKKAAELNPRSAQIERDLARAREELESATGGRSAGPPR